MTNSRAAERYRIEIEEPPTSKRWFRSLAVLVANAGAWIEGLGSGPSNPGGRVIKVVDNDTGSVVLEFVEEFGDDAQTSLSMLQNDIESQTVAEFHDRWL